MLDGERSLEAAMILVFLIACRGAYEGDHAGECTDGADNNRDGLFDCDDPGCAGSPACADTDTPDTTDTTDTDTPDTDTGPECTADDLGELYERYIEPLMTDAHPDTCNQCHLSGIDLSMYIQDTPCQSMACMASLGVVDLESPEDSAVLSYILQADPDSDLITEAVVQREYDGFLEWIQWSATCHDEVCGEIDDPCNSATAGSRLPDGTLTPLGGCDEDTLAGLFQENIWSYHGRCWGCHHVNGASRESYPSAPTFYVWNGDEADSSRQTMYNLIGLGTIDTADPAASGLLTKPLAEGLTTGTALGEVTGSWHGGGTKFADGDDADFLTTVEWVGYYTTCLTAD
jgi:hypothetical protein